MIHAINISVLIVGIVGVAAFNLQARATFNKADAQIQKYRLYEIRDKLIWLVAEDKLSEESSVFQFFYRSVDFLIRHTDQLNLKSVVGALREAENRGLSPSTQNEEFERMQNWLERARPEVRDVVARFYETMIHILVENSVAVRLVAKHPHMWLAARELRGLISRMFSTERMAYGFYKTYMNAMQTMQPTAHLT